MKKMMVAAAIVCAAAFAQAAQVKWQSGIIYTAKDATGAAGTLMANANARLVTAYLFTFADEAAYNAAKSLTNDKLYNDYIVGGKSATATANSTATGAANITQTGLTDGSDQAPQTIYGLVLYVDTKTAASYDNVDAFVKSSFQTGTWKDTSGVNFNNMAGGKSDWTAVGAVPEPTSGLLLLLGVAGLALRRRRA